MQGEVKEVGRNTVLLMVRDWIQEKECKLDINSDDSQLIIKRVNNGLKVKQKKMKGGNNEQNTPIPAVASSSGAATV
jgi:hypothetical protein